MQAWQLLTALCLSLTGPTAFAWGVKYSAHLAGAGLQNSREDGQVAGTTGERRAMEGLRIWTKAFGGNGLCTVRYQVHMSYKGWGDQVDNGALAGTEGESRPIEAVRIWLENCPNMRGIRYRVHVAEIGWQDWVKDSEVAGTTGRGLAVQAIAIELGGNSEIYPQDTPAKLARNDFWSRCGSDLSGLQPSSCAEVTRNTTAGCLDDGERNWAVGKGLAVFCIGASISSVCPCGCFEKGTRILRTDRSGAGAWVTVESLQGGGQVLSLSPDSNLGQLQLIQNLVSYRTKGPEKPDLYTFTTASGQTLSVTQNHAILLSDGRMVRARDVRTTDALLTSAGAPTAIAAITRHHTVDDVFNFLTDRPIDSPLEHLVAAEGLIVGDLLWQNGLSDELNQITLRQ